MVELIEQTGPGNIGGPHPGHVEFGL
jgi:hypothetical protein